LCHPRSSLVRRRHCTTLVTDIWRTDPGLKERFTEPLACLARVAIGPGDGPAEAREVTVDNR